MNDIALTTLKAALESFKIRLLQIQSIPEGRMTMDLPVYGFPVPALVPHPVSLLVSVREATGRLKTLPVNVVTDRETGSVVLRWDHGGRLFTLSNGSLTVSLGEKLYLPKISKTASGRTPEDIAAGYIY